MIGPGDEIAAGGEGQSGPRASAAGREQVIDALKDAFVQGRLARDEFDERVGKVLATYAELDALTADIPAAQAGARSPAGARSLEPARESHNRKVMQRGTAAGAGLSAAFAAALVIVGGGSPVVGLIVVPLAGFSVAVLLAGLLTLLSWVFERNSRRQSSQALPPGADGEASGPPAPADLGRPRQHRHDPPHLAEAAESRLRRPRSASPWPAGVAHRGWRRAGVTSNFSHAGTANTTGAAAVEPA